MVDPHFEKMLYDNALLIDAYTRAHMADPQPIYAAVVAETIEWLLREMRSECGGFYSALDADSGGEGGRLLCVDPRRSGFCFRLCRLQSSVRSL